jgi:hypothetical protein
MTYIANIPQATDKLSTSQIQIRNNFTALNNIYERNHFAYTVTTTDSGKHKYVEMVNSNPIASPPAPGLAALSGTIYTKQVSSASQLFYTPDATGNEYQLTQTNAANFASAGAGPIGWTWMGQGVVMAYGFLAHASQSTLSVTFPITFSSNPFSIQASGIIVAGADPNERASIGIVSVSTTGFTARTTTNAQLTGIYWTAIGKI